MNGTVFLILTFEDCDTSPVQNFLKRMSSFRE